MSNAKALKATATATKGAEKKLSLEVRWAKKSAPKELQSDRPRLVVGIY